MSLSVGSRIGPYEILSLLGTGGMGEVYRARDAKLNRDVALKVLPAAFATDADRLARFRREAQALGALNHPNVAHIYGFEDSGGMPALVLELVEGETLGDRLSRGSIELDEALRIALQIALALEAAHQQSIVHRDLKPANIKVRDDGSVKVLDFGLAKALEPVGPATAEAANSPTLTNRATELGVILGTAAYMSPEQARGKPVDKRADIWSFGVVVFEMLSGGRLFDGETVSDTLAGVLKADLDWKALPAATPAGVRRLLRRCLERDPTHRMHDIADARLEIEDALAGGREPVRERSPGVARRERAVWLATLVAGVAGSAALTLSLQPTRVEQPETRLQIVLPSSAPGSVPPVPIALSPDGRTVAYWAAAGGPMQLWIRPLAFETPQPVAGTEGASSGLAWAPDGRSILHIAGGLREVVLDGSASHPLNPLVSGFGMSRNASGVLLYAPANLAPLARVPLSGGAPEPASRVVPPQIGHRFPYFLPDGQHFLFLASGPPGVQGIFLGVLGSLDARRLVDADTAAVFSPPSFVVFGKQDALFAQRMNMRTFEMEGETIRLADRLLQNRTVFGAVSLAAAATGTIAYRQAAQVRSQLTWVDRTGKPVGLVGGVDAAESDATLRLSPDERTIVLGRRENGNSDLWTIANAPHGALQRFTSAPSFESIAAWSPDGKQIAYQSSRKGGGFYDLYRKPLGGGDETAILESAENKTMSDWSLDNKFWLFVFQGRDQVARDLWAMPVNGDGKPFQVTNTPFDETNARFSPDSRWIAYQSTATGSQDVYVRPFPAPGREWRISVSGGVAPRWRGDGGELYYAGRDNKLYAVRMRLPGTGDALEHETPVPLFDFRGSVFVPSRDGQRFLIREILDDPPTPAITLIQNWQRR